MKRFLGGQTQRWRSTWNQLLIQSSRMSRRANLGILLLFKNAKTPLVCHTHYCNYIDSCFSSETNYHSSQVWRIAGSDLDNCLRFSYSISMWPSILLGTDLDHCFTFSYSTDMWPTASPTMGIFGTMALYLRWESILLLMPEAFLIHFMGISSHHNIKLLNV